MSAYYNEFDAYPAQWLRNLSDAGHIATGRVDARSIRDVQPADVADATQAHFFAGLGAWSYALRLAGWPDDRPVWTGSCPCQPFSCAGKRGGTNDDRHLWPEWFRLICEQRPPVVFGEQVASPDGLAWFDAVSADLEGAGYATAAFDLCAAGVGAPHIRQRLYFVAYALPAGRTEGRSGAGDRPAPGRSGDKLADANEAGRGGLRLGGLPEDGHAQPGRDADGRGADGFVGHAERNGSGWHAGAADRAQAPIAGPGQLARGVGDEPVAAGAARGVGHADDSRPQGRRDDARQHAGQRAARAAGADDGMAHADGGLARDGGLQRGRRHDERAQDAVACDMAHPANERLDGWRTAEAGDGRGAARLEPQRLRDACDPWRAVEWVPCSDGKARPTQPGLFPLAHGATSRVGRLRAYGNAIVPQVAATFIRAFMEVTQ